MDWPQGVMAALLGLQVLIGGIRAMDGSSSDPALPPSAQIVGAAFIALLLHAGGFWS